MIKRLLRLVDEIEQQRELLFLGQSPLLGTPNRPATSSNTTTVLPINAETHVDRLLSKTSIPSELADHSP
jgi:hypothetical protein